MRKEGTLNCAAPITGNHRRPLGEPDRITIAETLMVDEDEDRIRSSERAAVGQFILSLAARRRSGWLVEQVTIDVERRASRLTATERDEMTPSLRRTCAAIVRLIEQTGSLVFVTVSTEALSDRRRLGLKSAADRRFGRRGASAALTITAHLRHRDAESIVVLTSSTTAPTLSASPAELPSPRRVDSAPPVSSPNDQLPPVVRAGVPTHINEARRFHPAGTRLIGLA